VKIALLILASILFIINIIILLSLLARIHNIDYTKDTINIIIDREPIIKEITVTAYSLEKDQCDNDLEHTATMTKPKIGLTAAVSRDNLHLLGKSVYIEGHGIRKVTDVMATYQFNRIDLLMTTSKAIKFTPTKAKVILLN